MTVRRPRKGKHIIDLALLNQFNAQGYPACGHKLNLGDPVVEACGAWEEVDGAWFTNTKPYSIRPQPLTLKDAVLPPNGVAPADHRIAWQEDAYGTIGKLSLRR